MSNQQPAKKSRLRAPGIFLAASAVSVLLGIGLCSGGGFNLEGTNSAIGNVGVFAFFLGILGIVIGFLWLIIAAIAGAGGSPVPPPKPPKDELRND
jgi:hypothetical protein